MQYRLFSFLVNTDENTLTDTANQIQCHIEPRTMAVLVLLIENPAKVINREEFLTLVWGNTIVEEEALSRCISELRKMLGDNPRKPTFIQTIHKKGYKLLVQPEVISPINSTSRPPPSGAVKNKKPTYLALIMVPIFAIGTVFFTFSMYKAANSSDPAISSKIGIRGSELEDIFETQDIEVLKQELKNVKSNNVVITFSKNMDASLSYTLSLNNQTNEQSKKTKFIIRNQDEQTLWELTRNFLEKADREKALNDVVLLLNSMQTSYLYQINKELPNAIHKKYRQALYYVDKRGAENLDKAIALFDEVIDHSPDFVEAIINKAAAIRNLNFYRVGLEQRKQRMIKFDLLLKQAASIDPYHPMVRAVNAKFDINKQNWREYEQTLQTAVNQAPNCYICVRFLAEFYVNIGYLERASDVINAHIIYFPLSMQMHALLGEIYTQQANIEKAREQVDILEALGSETSTDSLAIKINIYAQLGNIEQVSKLLEELVEKHPNTAQIKQALDAQMKGDFEQMRNIVKEMPTLHFNLGLSAGLIDEVFERLANNVKRGNIRDLGLLHGWLHGRTDVYRHYSTGMLALKNHNQMRDFLQNIGIIDYWEENGQWPDYCEDDQYLEIRPNYCPSTT